MRGGGGGEGSVGGRPQARSIGLPLPGTDHIRAGLRVNQRVHHSCIQVISGCRVEYADSDE